MPKPLTSGAKAKGRFGKQDFVYLADEDVYRCPAGETLTAPLHLGRERHEPARLLDHQLRRLSAEDRSARSGKERRIKRWEHEAVIDAMQERLDRRPDAMRIRRATVEHPFGTLKAWMGATHFKTRTLEKVRTEMSLHVLAYNLKRVIAILGVAAADRRRCGPEATPPRTQAHEPIATARSVANCRRPDRKAVFTRPRW